MRKIMFVALAAALVSASAAAKPMGWAAREASVWQAFKDKRAAAFTAQLAPNFVALYEDGTKSRADEVRSLRATTLNSFRFRNFSSRAIDAEDMLLTYMVDVQGTYGKDDISGSYWASSVWHRGGGRWVAVYHSEIKAK